MTALANAGSCVRTADVSADGRTALFTADMPGLVREDSVVLATARRRVLKRLPEEGRALAVGHSPTNEAAVLGLTRSIIAPMAKGAGVVVVAEGNQAHVEPAS